MIHPRLQALADEVLQAGMTLASQAELRGPLLIYQTLTGEIERIHITMPEAHPADVMKVLLYASGAIHAAVCMEGWGVKVAPPTDETERSEFIARARSGRRPPGMPQPRHHPERRDVLMLLGQTRGAPDRDRLYRQWTIEGSNPRRLTEDTMEHGELAPSTFWPMFVGRDAFAELVLHHASLAELREQVAGRRS
jgi:hypothetical protein